MEFLQTVDFETCSVPGKHDVQTQFDHFYETTLGLLDQFYPEKRVLLTSNDPEYITPEIKDDLLRKNKLMRATGGGRCSLKTEWYQNYSPKLGAAEKSESQGRHRWTLGEDPTAIESEPSERDFVRCNGIYA